MALVWVMATRQRIKRPHGNPPTLKQVCIECRGSGSVPVQEGNLQLMMYCPVCRGEGMV